MSLREPLSHGSAHDVQVPLSASDETMDTLDADLEELIGEHYDEQGNPLTNFSGRTASGEIGAHRGVSHSARGDKGQTHVANPTQPHSPAGMKVADMAKKEARHRESLREAEQRILAPIFYAATANCLTDVCVGAVEGRSYCKFSGRCFRRRTVRTQLPPIS